MRFTQKIIASALAVCLGVALGAAPAFADEETATDSKLFKTYNYTISISAGSGEFASGESVVQIPASLNDPVDLSAYSTGEAIVLPDDKYYVKGLRLAGHDFGEEALADPAFMVEGDAQYVVAYGLKKDQVAYTVNYVDANGNQIAEPQTFYGNAGDKPVVAFRYIDGYLPTTYNLTGTLKADGPNEFTFVYNAAPGVTYTEVANAPAAEGAPAAAGAGAAAAGTVPAGAADVAAAAAAGEIIGEDGTPLDAPEQIVDIDDEEVPLASGALPEDAPADSGNQMMLYLAGGCVLVVLIALIAVMAMRRKKANQEK